MPNDVDEVTRRLAHLTYAAAALTEAEHGLRDAVRLARAAGATWGQVEAALAATVAGGIASAHQGASAAEATSSASGDQRTEPRST